MNNQPLRSRHPNILSSHHPASCRPCRTSWPARSVSAPHQARVVTSWIGTTTHA